MEHTYEYLWLTYCSIENKYYLTDTYFETREEAEMHYPNVLPNKVKDTKRIRR